MTFATGHQFSLTVSWITKQQFVGGAVVEAEPDVLDEVMAGVKAFSSQLTKYKREVLMRNILRDVDVACRQVKSVAKRTTATLANIMAFVGKDRGFNQNEGGLKRRSPSKTELSEGRGP